MKVLIDVFLQARRVLLSMNSVYITVAGGMDFRAMLMKKKKPAKKVVEKVEWIEEPVDRCIKEGTCDEVHFTAKVSVKGKKAKWYLRNQECYKGPKFSFVNDEDTFTLIIKNPQLNDSGRYTCVIRECNDLTCKGSLEVEGADPSYGFKGKLKDKKGKTKRRLKLKCKVDNPEAIVQWFHNGKKVSPADPRFNIITDDEGNKELVIRECEMSDNGEWSCKIMEFGKEGEDEVKCNVEINEFQHNFTGDLKGKKDVAGMISCKTATGDVREAPLEVAYHNQFKK